MEKLSLEQLNRVSVDEFKSQKKNDLIVIVDNVRSALNVGSLFRTSDGFNVRKIYLCGITGTPPHKEINKTAIGATESVEWEYVAEVEDVVDKVKSQGYKLIGVEQTSESIMLNDFEIDTDGKYAIVMGNEVMGVSDELLPYLDSCIEIPMVGTKHSLNVSVCAGIVLWEFFAALSLKS